MKKILSLMLALIVAFGFSTLAFADMITPMPEPSIPGVEIYEHEYVYHVSNTSGAPVHDPITQLKTGVTVPYGTVLETKSLFTVNETSYVFAKYNNILVVLRFDDLKYGYYYPDDFSNPTADFWSDDSLALRYKDTFDLGVQGNVTYVSSNDAVISIDANGVVTALGEGTAWVKCVDVETGSYDSIKIEVEYAWWQVLIRIFLLGFLWY